MKKVLSLLAILTLFTFVACNNAANSEDPAAEQEMDSTDAEKMETEKSMEEPTPEVEAPDSSDNAAPEVEAEPEAKEETEG